MKELSQKAENDLLILLVGNAEKIISSNKLNAEEIEIVKLDEKILAKPKSILKQIRARKYRNIYFGTIKLNFQRFHTFMKIYMFLTGFCNSAILDEEGEKNSFSISKFFFIELPLFFFEIIYSILLVIFYHLKVIYLKWKYTKA